MAQGMPGGEWCVALVRSLQEGFFICDADGSVVEMNDAFADIVGYGAEGLPYHPPHPWWPDATTDPGGLEQATQVLSEALAKENGTVMLLPLVHRSGRRIWAAITFSTVSDAAGGRRMIVGTLRDVTAEQVAVEREAALARLTGRLFKAGSMTEVVVAALDELRGLWGARRSVAIVWNQADEIVLTCTSSARTGRDDGSMLAAMMLRRDRTPHVTMAADPASPGAATGAGTTLSYADGTVAVWVDFDPVRPFGADDRALLTLLCGLLLQALNRAYQSDQQRSVALALQRSILGPAPLPPDFAVRYEPAVRPLEVGGDWYDVVELHGGRIGIVVGDCVGRGLAAATVMGQLRSACRALLLQATGPAETLAALDRFAALIPGALCTTAFCGILDLAESHLRYSSAGHPPGIVVHADGEPELLNEVRGTPLAVEVGGHRPEATINLRPGSTLLLYTDGLIERFEQCVRAGIDRAAEVMVAGREAPVTTLADDLMTRLAPDGGYTDDVAILLYRRPDRSA